MARIDTLFNTLIDRKGSDLHLEEGQKAKIRSNGKLIEISEGVLTRKDMVDLLSEIADKNDWSSFESRGDLDFAYALGDAARFRANYFRHFFGLGAVFRLIPT